MELAFAHYYGIRILKIEPRFFLHKKQRFLKLAKRLADRLLTELKYQNTLVFPMSLNDARKNSLPTSNIDFLF